MDYPDAFTSQALASDQILHAMERVDEVLQKLVGPGPLVVKYGWGCELHPDLRGAPMRVGVGAFSRFITDSVKQQIVFPGASDIHLNVFEGRLLIMFSHEGGIHVGGSDGELIKRFVKAPCISEFFATEKSSSKR